MIKRSYWLLIGLLFSFSTLIADSTLKKDACVSCHIEVDEENDDEDKIVSYYKSDLHVKLGFSCADCHGGDPEAYDDEDEAMWENDTFIGVIEKEEQLEVCGKCHSNPVFMRQYSTDIKVDQVTQYLTSGHGIALENGNENVAVCSSCHGVHGILPVDDPRAPVYAKNIPKTCSKCHSDETVMFESGLPTNQFTEYEMSVHGMALLDRGDIGAPACNDCHGNHGASPPYVSNVDQICGTCHSNNKDLFQKSHLNDIFLSKGLGQCEACHGNHDIAKPTDEFLNWADESTCKPCHEDSHPAKALALSFYQTIDSLKTDLEHARKMVEKAEHKGMIVSNLLFDLDDAKKALIHTRTNIHSFNKAFVDTGAAPGFQSIQAAIIGAKESLEEVEYRKKGLFIFSLIITFFVIAIGFKINEWKKQRESASN